MTQILRTSGDKNRMQLGTNLGRLRKYRNDADYENTIPNIADTEGLCVGIHESMKAFLTGNQ